MLVWPDRTFIRPQGLPSPRHNPSPPEAEANSNQADESKCSKQCSGSVQTCGASGLIEIYSTGVADDLPPASPPPKGWEAVGCFLDPVTPRPLPIQKTLSQLLTVADCTSACEGYAFAGIEYGHECYCGASLDGVQKFPDTDCNMPCKGDPTVMCGSGGRMNVYRRAPEATGTTLATSTRTASLAVTSSATVPMVVTSTVKALVTSTPASTPPLASTTGFTMVGFFSPKFCFWMKLTCYSCTCASTPTGLSLAPI